MTSDDHGPIRPLKLGIEVEEKNRRETSCGRDHNAQMIVSSLSRPDLPLGMNMDVTTLVSAMSVGASFISPHTATVVGTIAATEVVKEVTKDAYRALRDTLGDLLGAKARRATVKLEADPLSQEAQDDLTRVVTGIDEEDAREIQAKLTQFLAALKDDGAAIRTGETVASIKLNVDSKGNVNIERLTGARTIDVAAKSEGDFNFSDINMGTGSKPQGN